jgi:hypothetical protein
MWFKRRTHRGRYKLWRSQLTSALGVYAFKMHDVFGPCLELEPVLSAVPYSSMLTLVIDPFLPARIEPVGVRAKLVGTVIGL